MEKQNSKALFLGPKSENFKFFKEMLNSLMDEHIFWRRDFHPDDKAFISHGQQRSEEFCSTIDRVQESLFDLSNKLKTSSMPWFSTRYLGHMNTDTLLPAVLGYMAGILYNPNNCAYEGSPATTEMELEVGMQLGIMLGYDKDKTWGHITSGGIVANYEGLWYARNIKSVPFAVKSVKPELLNGTDDWTLANLPINEILDLLDIVKRDGAFSEFMRHSLRARGLSSGGLIGKLLVPQSRHYSWDKAADILGIGSDNVIYIRVNDKYRVDIGYLKEVLETLLTSKIPVLALVSVVGTTEEGAVDEVHKIVKIREEYKKRGMNFYYHIDAAYGGYARTMFLDAKGAFMPYEELMEELGAECQVNSGVKWPSAGVYNAYQAMPEADSITIDCHKLGYIPYPAGAFVIKDKRFLDLISYKASYVEGNKDPFQLGPYIMEGSKAGAAAGAVWVAHRAVPLNLSGYGNIISQSMEAANYFYNSLLKMEPFTASDGRLYKALPLTAPDTNIVVFAFNEEGNANLDVMNSLNEKIYENCSFVSGPVYQKNFITSKTILASHEYGEIPELFVRRFNIPASEWERVKGVFVLRACIMSPFLSSNTTLQEYWERFIKIMKKVISEATPTG